LVDRYVASNAAYGAARLAAGQRAEFRAWVASVELGDLALPRPDLQILLRVPVDVARAQARARAALDASRAPDRYEADDALQSRVAVEYDELARSCWIGPWLTVDRAPAGPGPTSGDAARAASVDAAVEKVLHTLR
jgi:dTMP kinase